MLIWADGYTPFLSLNSRLLLKCTILGMLACFYLPQDIVSVETTEFMTTLTEHSWWSFQISMAVMRRVARSFAHDSIVSGEPLTLYENCITLWISYHEVFENHLCLSSNSWLFLIDQDIDVKAILKNPRGFVCANKDIGRNKELLLLKISTYWSLHTNRLVFQMLSKASTLSLYKLEHAQN